MLARGRFSATPKFVNGQIIDTDIQQQGQAFMMTCMMFTMGMMMQNQQKRDAERVRETGVRGLPKGMRGHAIRNGLVAPPPRLTRDDEVQAEVDKWGTRA